MFRMEPQILNFAIVFGVEVSNYFYRYANLIRYFLGMSFSTGIFMGCRFINVDFMVFLLYEVQ